MLIGFSCGAHVGRVVAKGNQGHRILRKVSRAGRLTRNARRLTFPPRQMAGRPLRLERDGEESPGSMETRCRVTPGGGDPRESATESKPPRIAFGRGGVRGKGCGKSAPRAWQQGRHGKPHREQDLIGMELFNEQARFQAPSGLVARGIRQRVSQMNGRRRLAGTEPGLQAI